MNTEIAFIKLVEQYKLSAKDISVISGYSLTTTLKWLMPSDNKNHNKITKRALRLIKFEVKRNFSKIKAKELSAEGFRIVLELLTDESKPNDHNLQKAIDISNVLKCVDNLDNTYQEDVLITRIKQLIKKYPECERLTAYIKQ